MNGTTHIPWLYQPVWKRKGKKDPTEFYSVPSADISNISRFYHKQCEAPPNTTTDSTQIKQTPTKEESSEIGYSPH